MSITTLIAIPSPRDIIATKESLATIKDSAKLYVKYFPEEFAYAIIQDYFLQHTEAEYLVIAPDDLIATEYHHNKLRETIEKYGKENMPTLAGICNVHNIPGYATQLAICVDRGIAPERRHRNYKWADLRQKAFRDSIKDKDRIQVKFSGFPFQFIRRDIVEKLGLGADLSYNPNHRIREGYSIDVVFCHRCNEQGIPLYVNPWVQMLHLRGSTNKDYPGIEPIQVWHKDPKVIVETSGNGTGTVENDITHLYTEYIKEYNNRRSTRMQSRIVPNPAMPGRLMTNYEHIVEARVPRQNQRSAGIHPARQRTTANKDIPHR